MRAVALAMLLMLPPLAEADAFAVRARVSDGWRVSALVRGGEIRACTMSRRLADGGAVEVIQRGPGRADLTLRDRDRAFRHRRALESADLRALGRGEALTLAPPGGAPVTLPPAGKGLTLLAACLERYAGRLGRGATPPPSLASAAER